MFEVGAHYEFRMIEGGGEVILWGDIAVYEHPLIKLADSEPLRIQLIGVGVDGSENHDPADDQIVPSQPGRIINVTSVNFVSAVRRER